MNGRRSFNELTKDFTPKRRSRVDAHKAQLRTAIPLHELRPERGIIQKEVGKFPKVK